jgi:hypothetical protein
MDQILREVIKIEFHRDNMNRGDSLFLNQEWKPLVCDLKEWRQSHSKVLVLSIGPWKGLTSSVLHSLHHHHLPFPLLIPTSSLFIGLPQSLPYWSWVAPLLQTYSPTTLCVSICVCVCVCVCVCMYVCVCVCVCVCVYIYIWSLSVLADHFSPEDGDSTLLWCVGFYQQINMAT